MYVAIDIGGTKTLLATMTPEGEIKQQVKFATSTDYQQFLIDLKMQAATLEDKQFMAGAAGAPAVLNRTEGLVVSCGNLGWKDEPLTKDLSDLFGCPFQVENDGKLGGLAEAILIKNEFNKVLYLAIGTGIGIAYTANGIIDTNVSDGGGLSIQLEHEGTIQPWESFASGSAIVRQFGKKASEITDPASWQQIAHNLSVGILDLLPALTPDVIVLGGGVGAHFEHFGQLLQTELTQHESSFLPIPPLRQAQHAEQAVIYGCYNLIEASLGKAAS